MPPVFFVGRAQFPDLVLLRHFVRTRERVFKVQLLVELAMDLKEGESTNSACEQGLV
jgi:hypothetical protein